MAEGGYQRFALSAEEHRRLRQVRALALLRLLAVVVVVAVILRRYAGGQQSD